MKFYKRYFVVREFIFTEILSCFLILATNKNVITCNISSIDMLQSNTYNREMLYHRLETAY